MGLCRVSSALLLGAVGISVPIDARTQVAEQWPTTAGDQPRATTEQSPTTAGDQPRAAAEQSPTTAGDQPRAAAEIGGLHRAAAAIEAVLDLYRLALIDLVPAASKVREAGELPPAGPATLLPSSAAEVFGRLADNLPQRVPAKALPVIARGYHAEIVDGFERLGAATQLGHVAAPLRDIVRGLQGVVDAADRIVDLYSRQRPIHMRLVDPDAMLGDISLALDEVMAAERKILRLRRKDASLGKQFGAARRLEIALGHALDLIAAAEEVGLHIGFEVQLATTAFKQDIERVRAHLVALSRIVDDLERAPAGLDGPVRIWLVELESGAIEAQLSWSPPRGEPRAAAVRIYRTANLAGIRERLAKQYRCEGHGAEQAEAAAGRAVAELTDDRELVSEEPPGRSYLTEPWSEAPIAPPAYHIVPVSPFGMEGRGPKRIATFVPRNLAGVSDLHARTLAPAARDASFYQTYDAVELTWQPSPNDTVASPGRAQLAAEHGLPMVAWYRILRVNERGDARTVARQPAGSTSFFDRLPLADLAGGLRYSVEAISETGESALPPDICALTKRVQFAAQGPLRLARLGMASIVHPTRVERQAYLRLDSPSELQRARQAFGERPAGEQERLLAGWWEQTAKEARRQFWAAGPSLLSAEERSARLSRLPEVFCARDLPRVQVEAWLVGEPPEVRDEVDRWWQLLDRDARERAVHAFVETANRELVAWVGQTHTDEQGSINWAAVRGVRLQAWIDSRDPSERAQLEQWWQQLDPADKKRRVKSWYETQSDMERSAMHWPDWEQLTEKEQQQRLATPPEPLPTALWRELLACVAWQQRELEGGKALEAALVREVGSVTRLLARLKYATRPLDVALGFRLRSVALILILLMAGTTFGLARRKKARR